MKFLFLICGPPGSGKTRLAEILVDTAHSKGKSAVMHAADDYFTQPDGSYHFRGDSIGLAHTFCQQHCEQAMRDGVDEIYIHNTFVKRAHFKNYYALAEKYSYFVQEIHLRNPRPEGSVHSVPAATVVRMMAEKEWH